MIVKHDCIYTPAGKNRPLHIYLPDDYYRTDRRYPVTYFFDGHNLFFDEDATYGKSWGLKEFMDGWSKDMMIVGIECGHEGDERLCEYLPYPSDDPFLGQLHAMGSQTLRWMVEEVKPAIDRALRTLPDRANTGIAGSSMGGLMSLYGVLHHNGCFSRAGCVSSSIRYCLQPLMEALEHQAVCPDTRVYLSWGSREAWEAQDLEREDPTSGSYRWNHTVADCLRRSGAQVEVYCQPGGEHNEASWEKQVPGLMEFLWG